MNGGNNGKKHQHRAIWIIRLFFFLEYEFKLTFKSIYEYKFIVNNQKNYLKNEILT